MATLQELLKNNEYEKIWDKYCGFLDLSIEEFMQIQERLLMEQIEILSNSKIGKKIMGEGVKPTSIEEFRKTVPLTTYEDYADILLEKKVDALPIDPQYWIKTTWKGGTHDTKLAPYSKEMIDEHTKSFIASLILSTSKRRGHFDVRVFDKFLYGMAPLPYLTGLVPHALQNEIEFTYLPSLKEAETLGFRERNKVGFELALNNGVDFFFGLSSVLVKIGEDFMKGPDSKNKTKTKIRPSNLRMIGRFAKAFVKNKIFNKPLLPKDLFKFKGIICAGTDTRAFKDKIERLWGTKPLELFGGTEIATVGVESWRRNGLTFFPDVNFLEFIPEAESKRSLYDQTYIPTTVLLNELEPGKRYELVTTKFRGGVFARYRVGDMIECVSTNDSLHGINLPQFNYVDRISNVIDLAGFTRITEGTIEQAFQLSDLKVNDWIACKEYENNEPILNLYLETDQTDNLKEQTLKDIVHRHLKELDSDYRDIESLLGRDPLKLTVLESGTFKAYKENNGTMIKINPSREAVNKLVG
ncbi:GH3 family domain-containing protein [Haloplasma contractile]|uniref:GH3 auxin-responsive promoter protein n=1 Tax=Haloplasma contractile SSD-17B TaxID=1033810 RepID=U2EB20_9MOLU|nr:GH3 auxin-responsive promoter family protein [Haloplasma contractile]ERJ11991.1 GH3 auxin-responsive promoter protein [Haloplasma contractile SSD-17B]